MRARIEAGRPIAEIGRRWIGSSMPDAPELVAEPAPIAAERAGYSPVVWLSLLCLDAPIVAVAWQWLFARTFDAHLDLSLRALLFLTAWLIYLADRFADTIKLPADSPISLRHRFCREHMIGWWIAIVVIFFRRRCARPAQPGSADAAPRRHARRDLRPLSVDQSFVRRKVAAASRQGKGHRHSLRGRHDPRE